MNNPNYKPPVETEPTPLRSDTYHSLMTRDVAEKVFARYERGRVFDPYHDRPMTELEKEILENPTLGTTPQREVIIKGADQEMMDYRQEEAFNLRRSRLFYLCFFTSMFGVVLMLYALSATVLFEKYDENPLAFYCSFVLFVPGMVWIIYVYLPCKQERERRKRMARARKLREHLKTVRQKKPRLQRQGSGYGSCKRCDGRRAGFAGVAQSPGPVVYQSCPLGEESVGAV
jgi:hypothetical protein